MGPVAPGRGRQVHLARIQRRFRVLAWIVDRVDGEAEARRQPSADVHCLGPWTSTALTSPRMTCSNSSTWIRPPGWLSATSPRSTLQSSVSDCPPASAPSWPTCGTGWSPPISRHTYEQPHRRSRGSTGGVVVCAVDQGTMPGPSEARPERFHRRRVGHLRRADGGRFGDLRVSALALFLGEAAPHAGGPGLGWRSRRRIRPGPNTGRTRIWRSDHAERALGRRCTGDGKTNLDRPLNSPTSCHSHVASAGTCESGC